MPPRMGIFKAPPRCCRRCGQTLGSPHLGYRATNLEPKEIWTCPDRHESWAWSPRNRRWSKHRLAVPIDVEAFAREAAASDAKRCPLCQRRMVRSVCRDYKSSTEADAASLFIHVRWVCRCGFDADAATRNGR